MNVPLRTISAGLLVLLAAACFIKPSRAVAASAYELDRDSRRALAELYSVSPKARALGPQARAILVFPTIVKAGFIVGGQYGEGALLSGGQTIGYYSTVQASYGLQAGVQKYGYALFFMTDSAAGYINRSDGWELGVGPSIVVLDKGAAGAMTSTTMKSDIYAAFFSQKGLMGGLGLQGTKITRIKK